MKKFAAQSILLIIVIAAALIFFSPVSNAPKLDLPFLPQTAAFKTLDLNGNKLNVEVADTPSKRNKGLSDRSFLRENEGMLFVYNKADKVAFWMKGMKFPLDFVWIIGDSVVDILPNIPPPAQGQKEPDLPIYSSKEMVDKVLEVNGGTSKKLNIKVGDLIKLGP